MDLRDSVHTATKKKICSAGNRYSVVNCVA
jgi:hypothetical protein